MRKKKQRIAIPKDVAASVLVSSDHTCCECEERLSPVQIHHIDENPSNNNLENLAVLCLTCHNLTQISGGFGRRLDAESVRLYRDQWVKRVEVRRRNADAAFLARTSSEEDRQEKSKSILIFDSPSSISSYIETMPEVLAISYRRAKETWFGSTIEALRSAYDVTEVLKIMWLQLANSFPAKHFGNVTSESYLETYLERQYAWHAALCEPSGPGTGGTIVGVLVSREVLNDLAEAVVQLRNALSGLSESLENRSTWNTRWKAAQHYLDNVKYPEDALQEYTRLEWLNPKIYSFTMKDEVIKISARPLGNGKNGETSYALFKQRRGGAEFFFDIAEGHHVDIHAIDLDGDGLEEIVVTYSCGAHTRVMVIYSLADARGVPERIPGGLIGSDWPEFSWEKRIDGPGSILTKKDRDWPTMNFLTSKYLFSHGQIKPYPDNVS